MAWTYAGTTGSVTSTKDQVRLLCGQTSSVDQALLYDAEITYLLTQNGGVYFAAAVAAETLGSKYASLALERAVGQTRVKYLDRAQGYRQQAQALRRQGMTRGIQVYVGGASVAEQQADLADTTRTQPPFRLGMDDNPPLYGSSS